MSTTAQKKAQQNNWMVSRLKAAEQLFSQLHYLYSDPRNGVPVIIAQACDGITTCKELQILIKEQYWKEREATSGSAAKESGNCSKRRG